MSIIERQEHNRVDLNPSTSSRESLLSEYLSSNRSTAPKQESLDSSMFLASADFKIVPWIGGPEHIVDTEQTTDDVLGQLTRRHNIKELNLSDSDVTDEGLEKLVDLKSLRSLVLANTQVGDTGLKNLAKAGPKNLNELNLDATNVTDKGMETLKAFEGLQHLSLRNTSIGDDGLKHIANELKHVRVLDLSHTGITDEGLKYLALLPNLTDVVLDGTKITAKGLEHLHKCKKLRQVGLQFLDLPKPAVDKLRESLAPFPGPQIYQ